jgi:Protein of unknown function (DUF3305)
MGDEEEKAASSEASSTALARIAVAVLVERRKAKSPWLDFIWQPVAVLAGNPVVAPWTPLNAAEDPILFYAGEAVIELYRTETANYRSNLTTGAPVLWVVLRPDGSEHTYKLLAVTADPAEGEAYTDAGNDLVGIVPMPAVIAETIGDFVALHHIERPFLKRRRERATSQAPARCDSGGESEE